MSQFDASNANCEYVQCAVCEKTITGGKWFARLKHGEFMVALCCPLCTEAFESKPGAYVRRIETLQFIRDAQSQSPLNE
ncbi:MAG: hypothetical protein J0M24_00345 [Verrucomicrobia bacterium]|jgi:hypothetical protein|nr:hypothetical protein [Verrucomicrobiota bacterium]